MNAQELPGQEGPEPYGEEAAWRTAVREIALWLFVFIAWWHINILGMVIEECLAATTHETV